MTGLFTFPERRPGLTIATIGLLFALAYGASLLAFPKPDGRILMGDALHHYVQLRSAVFDRDLQFHNEYTRMYGLDGRDAGPSWMHEPTATGHVRNLMPVGPAIVWAPGFLIVSGSVWIADRYGAAYPLDGYGRVFQATAGLGGIVAATLGAWFAFLASAAFFDRRAAIWGTLAIWLSSSALYYSLISPMYSHAASMLAVGGFWLAWTRTLRRQTAARYGSLGLLVGAAALMRWQDAILLVVVAADAVWHLRAAGLGPTVRRISACAIGALLAFVPQMLVWWVLYGTPLAIPQGPGFMRWTEPALGAVLLSDNHGLFTWTPVVVLAVVGLVLALRRAPLVALGALLFVSASWYVNAAVADWWAGEAFGARRFVSCFPMFVLGMGAVFELARKHLAVIASVSLALVAHTLLLLVQYQAFMHGLRDIAPYPQGVDGLWLARFRVPFDLVAWWLRR